MLSLPILLLLLVAIGGSGAMVGILGWLFHRLSRLESHADFEGLREQLGSVQRELSALTERVEFTENLLENRGAAQAELPPGRG
jgi:hypothetical protein